MYTESVEEYNERQKFIDKVAKTIEEEANIAEEPEEMKKLFRKLLS